MSTIIIKHNSISYEAPLRLVISPPAPINIRNSWVSGLRRTSHTHNTSGPVSVDGPSSPLTPTTESGGRLSEAGDGGGGSKSSSSRHPNMSMYFNQNAKNNLNGRSGSGSNSKQSSNPRVPLAAESTVEVSEATVL
jgi:hypothetical protein